MSDLIQQLKHWQSIRGKIGNMASNSTGSYKKMLMQHIKNADNEIERILNLIDDENLETCTH